MFNLSEIINNISNKITNNQLLVNPFYVGIIIISFILVIVFMVAYDEIEVVYEDTTLTTLVVKSTFFSFVGVLTILFLAFNNIDNLNKKKYKSKADAKTVAILGSLEEDTINPKKY